MYKVANQTRRTTLVDQAYPAFTFWQRLKGLLGTRKLSPGEGLWLKPCSSIHSFGMRFVFDAVFLDKGLKVVAVFPEVRPGRVILPAKGAVSVLELPAGTISSSWTAVGDQIVVS